MTTSRRTARPPAARLRGLAAALLLSCAALLGIAPVAGAWPPEPMVAAGVGTFTVAVPEAGAADPALHPRDAWFPGVAVQTPIDSRFALRLSGGYADVLLGGESLTWTREVASDDPEAPSKESVTLRSFGAMPISLSALYYLGMGNVQFYGGAGLGTTRITLAAERKPVDAPADAVKSLKTQQWLLTTNATGGVHISLGWYSLFAGVTYTLPVNRFDSEVLPAEAIPAAINLMIGVGRSL